MLLTNKVQIEKRVRESPLNIARYNGVYRWKDAICTNEGEFLSIPKLARPNLEKVVSKEPTEEYMTEYIQCEDDVTFYAYKFDITDFGFINSKISTDLCSNKDGELFLDYFDSVSAALTTNPLSEPFFVIREKDGTLHLQNKFEELVELWERGYNGKIWTIIADYYKN